MDVNGTRFHLFKDAQDWRRGRLTGQPDSVEDWYDFGQTEHASDWLHVAWDAAGGLRLASMLPRFPRSSRDLPLTADDRRGSAVDQFGNWYWIANDRRRLFWQPSGSGKAAVFWSQEADATDALSSSDRQEVELLKGSGDFAPVDAAATAAAPHQLGGMAVTTHHYLVVGTSTLPGLLIFDLHAGGPPLELILQPGPDGQLSPFSPFDMAAAPDGGLWVLDRVNRTYWRFDRTFQVAEHAYRSAAQAGAESFRPVDAKPESAEPASPPAEPDDRETETELFGGFDLSDLIDPISIEAGPDESVLILDAGSAAPSVVHHRLRSTGLGAYPLADEIDVVDLDGSRRSEPLAIAAHDMVYVDAEKRLTVVELDGNQAIAFRLDLSAPEPDIRVETTYLPMTNHGGRGLVGRFKGQEVEGLYYEVVGSQLANDAVVRWVKLQPIDRPRFEPLATIDTPVLDGRVQNCVWHRLFIDGCIPADASIEIWTRAHDDPAMLPMVPYVQEPDLYLRQQAAEIPFYAPSIGSSAPGIGVGTWELLCQQMEGRYGQLRLVLSGNGRVTPQIQALRLYYPRFSYPQHYLPAAYSEDDLSASFLERMLANMEGTFSELEGKLGAVYTLFDGRTAPEDTLDWLAGWLGLIVDPIWATIQQQRLESRSVNSGEVPDRRRLFIRFARKLYERRGTPDGIKFALQLLLEPCLEQLLDRFHRAAVAPDDVLAFEFALYGLAQPTPNTGEEAFEDLLYDYLLAPRRPSTVRIVERFQTRNGRAAAAGDPTEERDAQETLASQAPTPAQIAADAHRFAVLVPETLTPEEEAMIQRIVNLEKPAHTFFEVRRYWDYYRIGEARMGLDTILGESSRFGPILLGRDALAAGYLAAGHPFNAKDRLIVA